MRQEDLHRVILHLDFDSYYTQVEMKRLGIPAETPCAVQQWEGLIAVNYPARARGVTRHMRVKEARKICPELVLVHVETIGADGSGEGGADTDVAAAAAGEGGGGGAAAAAAAGGGSNENRRLTQKACLERYRRSTAEVLVLLHRLAPSCTIEKASIDEVYMDVTSMVDQEVTQSRTGAGSSVDAFGWNSIVIGGPLDPSSQVERRLAAGAGIACRLRGALREQMGYTASAGIATNKLLAKIGSAMHKPNQQTVIPPRSVAEVMQDLPLSKLRGFGGKLGEQLEALGCTTAGQVQQLARATLVARFGGERAAAIDEAVRGVSHEAVQEKERPKSMLAAKSFNPTSDLAALEGWFRVLAQELATRMAADEAQFRRRPKNLVVHYRGGANASSERSKSCSMPRSAGGSAPSAAVIAEAAFNLFKSKCASEALPCSRLAISAADFADLPAANGSAITRFFAPKAAAAATAGEAAGGGAGEAPAAAAAAVGCGASGSGREDGNTPAPEQQQQQQQQQGPAGTGAGTAPAGPSITRLFERAQKRQRLEGQQQAQQAQQVGAGACEAAADTTGAAQAAAAEVQAAIEVYSGGVALTTEAAAEEGTGAAGGAAGHAAVQAAAQAATQTAAAPAEAQQAEDPDAAALAGVDIEEQKRILRDIAMFQRLAQRSTGAAAGSGNSSASRVGGGARGASGGGGGKGRGKAAGGGRGKGGTGAGKQQPGISAFFAKQQ